MDERNSRTEMLLGEEGLRKLAASRVAVFGLGGVGGYAVEALARSGVGALDLIDSDCFEASNLNRQLYATVSTLGESKAEAAKRRVSDIAPACKVEAHRLFYLPETEKEFEFGSYDYIVDAVDTIAAKLSLAQRAYACGTPIVSSMGTGNKLDPTRFEVADIFETSVCPLARVMRRELKKRGVERLKVVYSREEPLKPEKNEAGVPGSVAFVPAVAGLILAGEVVRDLVGITRSKEEEHAGNRKR